MHSLLDRKSLRHLKGAESPELRRIIVGDGERKGWKGREVEKRQSPKMLDNLPVTFLAIVYGQLSAIIWGLNWNHFSIW